MNKWKTATGDWVSYGVFSRSVGGIVTIEANVQAHVNLWSYCESLVVEATEEPLITPCKRSRIIAVQIKHSLQTFPFSGIKAVLPKHLFLIHFAPVEHVDVIQVPHSLPCCKPPFEGIFAKEI